MSGPVELVLGDSSRVPVRVLLSPYLSICAMVTDSPGVIPRGLPTRLATVISDALGPEGHSALTPIRHPGHGLAPDLLHPPFEYGQPLAISDALEALRAANDNRLLEQLEAEFGTDPPRCCWGTVVEHPARWLDQLAGAIGRAADAVAGTLQWSIDRLNREADRIGAAVARGSLDIVLTSLNSRICLVGDTLQYHHQVPGRTELDQRPLVLAPILAGPRMMITNFDLPDAAYLAYSVRPTPPARTESTGDDDLAELIGTTAARLLRRLDRTHTVNQLSALLVLAPSSVSEQCTRLERLGLIHRERRGRSVAISRTERAEDLLELFWPDRLAPRRHH